MAGTMFVVCVPTKEHESDILEQQQPRRIASTGSFGDLGRAAETLRDVRLSTRSKSEDSLFVSGQDSQDERVGREQKPGQEDGGSHRREMFIGPWRVDASDLPSRTSLTPGSRRGRAESHGYTPAGAGLGPGRKSRSPLLDTANMSRSEPDGLATRQADTPYSNYKRRRHRFLESELEKILQELKIHNAVWCMGRSNRFYQVLFSIESGDPCEEALQKLAERGIGVLLNSVVSVLPCVLYYQGSEKSGAGSEEDLSNDVDKDRDDECPGSTGTGGGGGGRSKAAEQGTWERFVQSVRARLTVAQVVEGVRANATFNFDFLLLVTVAAFVAALGLFEDSTIILVASTLISPLMGPVMAATFGTMIRDWQLQRMGLINECVGLLHCLVIAFVTGVAVSLLDQPMPTAAMVDGGLLRSLWVNVLIATLSGMGIAIALLRDNTGSLVGVAISASLLPPAVNAGLLWAMSLVYYMMEPFETEQQYTSFFSDRPEIEMAVLGGVSLCTTFINIVFVYITGILMLKVKEVAPNSQAHQRFWKHDVKIARDYNATLYGASAAEMLRSVVNQENCGRGSEDCCDGPKMDDAPLTPELARLLQLSSGFSSHFGGSGGLGRGHRANPRYLDVCDHQLTWSPSTCAAADPHHDLHHHHQQQHHQHGDTVRELEGFYRTIRHQHQLRQQQQHHLAAAAGQGNSRKSSFGSGITAASWRLGRSDGYRCSLNKTPQGHGSDCRCFSRRSRRGASTTTTASATANAAAAGDAAGAVASPAVALTLTMCTPPFNNMPTQQSVLFPDPAVVGDPGDAWTTTPVTTRPPPASVSAFKTPLAAIADGTPPSAFMTPVDGADSSASCPSTAPRTVMTVDNETAAPARHRRPSRTRRFVVTKADDTEMLLPRK